MYWVAAAMVCRSEEMATEAGPADGECGEVPRIFGGRNPTAEQHREHHPPELNHVSAAIEARGAAAVLGRKHAEVLPEPIDRQLQSLERGAQDVLGDYQPSIGCQHDAVRGEAAMRDSRALLLQVGHRGRDVLDHTRRERELNAAARRRPEYFGQPPA